MSEDEHWVRVEAVQVYATVIYPNESRYLTGDGEGYNPIRDETTDTEMFDLDFEEERKLTFECACGRRFRKPETAREHLEKFIDE